MSVAYLAFLLALVGVALSSGPAPLLESGPEAFPGFVAEFGKKYNSPDELQLRRSIFLKNYQDVVEHNKRYKAKEVSWYKKIHADMDLTSQELKDKRNLGGLPPMDKNTKMEDVMDEKVLAQLESLGEAPRDFDWVSQGAVSSAKDQGNCGSCSAFSSVGAIESCFYIKTGQMDDDLSEQYLLDCGKTHEYIDAEGAWGASGCNGAWPQAYVDWVVDREMMEEDFYRYASGSGKDFRCNPPSGSEGYHKQAKVTGLTNTWSPNELDMEQLVRINPVVTSVQVPNPPDEWWYYGGGVLDASYCCEQYYDSECKWQVNHAVLIVGYGHDSYSGLDYWLIKNSWGSWWGENGGYLKLKKGYGHCGVGSTFQLIPTCEAA